MDAALLARLRARFPALATDWALLDNAGGSAVLDSVIAEVGRHMAETPVQLGASYPLSVRASERVKAGRAAVARLWNTEPNRIVLGPSSTALVQRLVAGLRPSLEAGDEVVVTNVDHEANIGPWRRLEADGVVVREWGLRPETAELHPEDLNALLNDRTRLVACTAASNVVGSIHDVAAIRERVHAVGARLCVDVVAYAAHRRFDVEALGVDYAFLSFYKVFGPHMAALYGRPERLRELANLDHFFVGDDDVPRKLEPGNVNYELTSSLPAVVDYLEELGREVGAAPDPLDGAFEWIAATEAELIRPLLGFLAEHPRVRLLGRPDADPAGRVGLVTFVVDGQSSAEIVRRLEERRLAVRFGHFYAPRALKALGLSTVDGVVRVSVVHTSSPDELARLVEGLSELL